MTILAIVCIVSFIFGAATGTTIGLFMAGVGKINEEYEYYHEGFIDGYTKAKEEVK